MPQARRHTEQQNDTEPESESETPRPQKSHLRKRLSEAFIPDNDASFTSDNGARAPLRTVNINDDAAEKRRRRKSTKLALPENALAGPSGANDGGAKQKQQQQLNAVAPPETQEVEVPALVLNGEKYEEWMKMATDNKINTQNSWNTALIDYFHDMTLLRNMDDNSINFQRASCTLEGCVKIWTNRVDSVGNETGKLLNNLETGSRFDEDHDSDNPDADPTQARRKRNRAGAATLATNPDKIKQKKPDLEFAVDPLFRKTCADFDEGGAGGLLMNHLSLGIGSEGCMRVIFDGSDVMRNNDEEEVVVDEPPSEIDLKDLRQKFFPDLSVLDSKGITSSLSDFSWGDNALVLDDSTFFQDDTPPPEDNYDDDENEMPMDHYVGPQEDSAPVEDFFDGPEAVDNDYQGDMGGNYDDDNHSNAGSIEAGADEERGRPGQFVPFDPRRMPSGRDMMMAMVDGEEGTLDYFDQKFRTNWAGPEHWKIRRNIRKPEGEAAGAKPAKRQKKEAVKIDFLAPAEKDLKTLTEELFAAPGKGATINLPGTGKDAKKGRNKKKEKKNDHRLPDDMHFSSKQLVTLFLKPKFMLKMRGKRVKMTEGEVDEQFWAQAAAGGNTGNNDDDNEQVPFSTQFFHEDDGFDDDGGFDGGFDGDGGGMPGEDPGEQDLIAATQGPRRVRPEAVNYARKAKRVDVRKLKDNIWKGLDIVIKKESDGDDEMDVDDEDAVKPTDPNESRQFSQVITGLQRSYPRDKMEEISTSFCFICLLHLANEQGLKLETAAATDGFASMQIADDAGEVKDGDDDNNGEDDVMGGVEPAPEDRKIGNIWDIKIYRDPNATQSA